MALTDEQIDSLFSEWLYIAPGRTYEEHRPVARAIEAAATAPLLERIAELEQQLLDARKDAERWRTFLSTRPKATHDVINQAIDDAAMQKGKT